MKSWVHDHVSASVTCQLKKQHFVIRIGWNLLALNIEVFRSRMMTIYKDGANKTDLSFSLKQTQINTNNPLK